MSVESQQLELPVPVAEGTQSPKFFSEGTLELWFSFLAQPPKAILDDQNRVIWFPFKLPFDYLTPVFIPRTAVHAISCHALFWTSVALYLTIPSLLMYLIKMGIVAQVSSWTFLAYMWLLMKVTPRNHAVLFEKIGVFDGFREIFYTLNFKTSGIIQKAYSKPLTRIDKFTCGYIFSTFGFLGHFFVAGVCLYILFLFGLVVFPAIVYFILMWAITWALCLVSMIKP